MIKKKLLLLFILLLGIISSFMLYKKTIKKHNLCCLDILVNDLKHYKTTSNHRGHLYAHSMWVEQYISQWTSGEGEFAFFMKKFSPRECYIIALSGLLHDIGKAGDLDCSKFSQLEAFIKKGNYIYYFTKLDHEHIGLGYVLHDIKDSKKYQSYQMFDEQYFNFKTLFHELQITEQEQKLIATLIGVHKNFTEVVLGKMSKELFLNQLVKTAYETGYISTNNELLLNMAVIISVADAFATYYPFLNPKISLVFGTACSCSPRRRFRNEKHDLSAIFNISQMKQKIELIYKSLLDMLHSNSNYK